VDILTLSPGKIKVVRGDMGGKTAFCRKARRAAMGSRPTEGGEEQTALNWAEKRLESQRYK